MARQLTRSLEVLLTRSIDYAGVFPPASLSVTSAVENYLGYSQSQFAWMLRRLVILPEHFSVSAVSNLLRVNSPETPNGMLAVVSDTDCIDASSIESKTVVVLGKPTYCEVPQDRLIDVLCVGSAAKIRMAA